MAKITIAPQVDRTVILEITLKEAISLRKLIGETLFSKVDKHQLMPLFQVLESYFSANGQVLKDE